MDHVMHENGYVRFAGVGLPNFADRVSESRAAYKLLGPERTVWCLADFGEMQTEFSGRPPRIVCWDPRQGDGASQVLA